MVSTIDHQLSMYDPEAHASKLARLMTGDHCVALSYFNI